MASISYFFNRNLSSILFFRNILVKLSTRARYALQLMVCIARTGDGVQPVSLDKVAKSTRISRRYLEQLATALRQESLVVSSAGRSGGYLLARPAKDIRIGHIIQAGIGPINIVDCVRKPETCMSAEACECRPIYQLLNQRITEVLNDYSLADLADDDWLAKAREALRL